MYSRRRPVCRRTLDAATLPTGSDVDDFVLEADISRIGEIASGDLSDATRDVHAEYSYLGAGTIVTVEHAAGTDGLVLNYGPTAAAGLDRFGRVTSHAWTNDPETTTFDEFTYTYDELDRLTDTVNKGQATFVRQSGTTYEYEGRYSLRFTPIGNVI